MKKASNRGIVISFMIIMPMLLIPSKLVGLDLLHNWNRKYNNTKAMKQNGGFFYVMELGQIHFEGQCSLKLTLEHYENVAAGKEESRWVIPQLYTSVHYSYDGRLTWLRPGGRTATLPMPLSRIFKETSLTGVYARKSNEEGVEISEPDGVMYKYKDQSLESIRLRDGTLLNVVTSGGIIKKISLAYSKDDLVLLNVSLNKHGMPQSLFINEVNYGFDYLAGRRQLEKITEINKNGFRYTEFSYYNNGLLKKISDGSSHMKLIWKIREDHRKWGQRYSSRKYRLLKVNDVKYDYIVDQEQVSISVNE